MPSNIPANGATQRDIAKSLALSRSTVAFALNPKHKHKLQPETVKLVQEKAAELNYHPRREAQILRQGRSNSIGVVFRTPIYHAQHEGASYLAQAALTRGYQPTAIDLQWFKRDEEAARRHLLDSSPDGAILNNLQDHEAREWETFLKQRHIPVVSIGEVVPDGNATIIGADRTKAFHDLTQHHLACGSRKLALLLPHPVTSGTTPPRPLIFQRFYGFRNAIMAAGGTLEGNAEVSRIFDLPRRRKGVAKDGAVAPPSGLVLYLPLDLQEVGDVFKIGYDYVMQASDSGELPDSLICSNDDIAAGAITAAIELDIPIPQRLKVSGADDASYSAFSGIPITTIRPPTREMVNIAIDELLSRMEQRQTPPPARQILMPYELVIRKSTVQPPKPCRNKAEGGKGP